MGFLKRVAEFIVFRNVFIAIAAVALVAETRFLSGNDWKTVDAFIAFTFFSTFLTYNFHSFSNDSENEFSIQQLFFDFINPAISLEQRICVGIGIVSTGITILFLKAKVWWLLVPVALITMAYSLPIFKIGGRLRSLRDIMYVKIFTVAFTWALSTTVIPYLYDNENVSLGYIFLLFLERLLFIYAITIPFEIRDRHSEKVIGNRTIPLVYGVSKSKMLGYIVLIAYCFVVLAREFIYNYSAHTIVIHFIALFLSAVSAGLLIAGTNDSRNKWYYKFLLDGTMIEQFFLLLLLSNL